MCETKSDFLRAELSLLVDLVRDKNDQKDRDEIRRYILRLNLVATSLIGVALQWDIPLEMYRNLWRNTQLIDSFIVMSLIHKSRRIPDEISPDIFMYTDIVFFIEPIRGVVGIIQSCGKKEYSLTAVLPSERIEWYCLRERIMNSSGNMETRRISTFKPDGLLVQSKGEKPLRTQKYPINRMMTLFLS